METEIKVINKSVFLGKEIDVYGTIEEPLFLAKDVAEWIGHTQSSVMVDNVDDDEKVKVNNFHVDNRTGGNGVWLLTENGLYEVLMQSRKPIAKQFKKGVKEILKNIRRNGFYAAPQAYALVETKLKVIEFTSKFLNLNEASKLMMIKSVAGPLGLPTPDYVPSKGVLHSASELLKRHNINMSAAKFNALLIKQGYLDEAIRKGSTKEHKFKVITPKGLAYGENEVSPHNQKETQPHWYDSKFDELLEAIEIQR